LKEKEEEEEDEEEGSVFSVQSPCWNLNQTWVGT
jgi:hypothetical protein